MKAYTLAIILIGFALLSACSPIGNEIDQPSGAAGAAGFQAQADSPVSVQLTWSPQTDATQYSIELSFGDEFFTIATLGEDAVSYEDFPVPDDTELTYRLRALSGDAVVFEQTLTLTTPPIQPDPLVVQANEFQAAAPEMPILDPTDPNFDPDVLSSLPVDPETGEIDIDALMQAFVPEPISASADIGPEGGQVSVTDPNGIIYTLMFPEGALEEVTTITLSPVESIEGLPLDTFLAAVHIYPQGLPLEYPALLTYTFPESIDTPEGSLTINFGYEGSGNEFFFVPYYEGSDSLAMSQDAAKLSLLRPFEAGPLSGISIPQLGSRGIGQGTATQVRNAIKNQSPSRRASQRSNQAAAAQMDDYLTPLVDDELAPLVPEHLSKAAHEVGRKIDGAGNATELSAAISDFESYINNYGDQPTLNELTEELWNQLVDKTRQEFEKNRGECLSEQAFAVQAIGGRMAGAGRGFWKDFADRFKSKYGDDLIKDIETLIRKCKFEFVLAVSDITTNVDGAISSAYVDSTFSLKITLDPIGRPALKGSGIITYQGAPETCGTTLNMNTLTGSQLEIWGLYPQYGADGKLDQLNLDIWSASGKQKSASVICEGVKGAGASTIAQTGDLWGGMFIYAHFPDLQLRDWDMNSEILAGTASSGTLAEKKYDLADESYFGGGFDEFTIMQVKITVGE